MRLRHTLISAALFAGAMLLAPGVSAACVCSDCPPSKEESPQMEATFVMWAGRSQALLGRAVEAAARGDQPVAAEAARDSADLWVKEMPLHWIHHWSFDRGLDDLRWRERYTETTGLAVRAYQAVEAQSPDAARRLAEARGGIDAFAAWAGHPNLSEAFAATTSAPAGVTLDFSQGAGPSRTILMGAVGLLALLGVSVAYKVSRRRSKPQ